MDPLDRFVADAAVALRLAVADGDPAALVWSADREGLAVVALVQAAWGGACPLPILVEPCVPAGGGAWRERLARSWDLDIIRIAAPADHGPAAGERLDRASGRWETATLGPHPLLVTGRRADADPALVSSDERSGGGRRIHPLADWDDELLTAWLARIGVAVPA